MAIHVHIYAFLLLTIGTTLVISKDPHEEFPQWDAIPWLVPSTDNVILNCTHPVHYPFNDINQFVKVQWILPKPTSYRHLMEGNVSEGWKMTGKDHDYQLLVDKQAMNVPESVNGVYVCAVLATAFPDTPNNSYAWYYLRWGLGLYTNVPAINEGTLTEKYYWCFTYAWVAVLVSLVIIMLFSLTVHFRYKGGPVGEVEFEGFDEASDVKSLSLTLEEKPSSSNGKSKKLEVDMKNDE